MAQKQTFVYKAPPSTRTYNDHIAKLVAPGLYHGLMIVPTAPQSMYVGLTAGYALTDEGVKIEETEDVGIELGDDPTYWPELKFLQIDDPDADYPRRDLIVMRHRYNPNGTWTRATPAVNPASYVVIKGTPTPYIQGEPQAKLSDMEPGDIPMAEILVSPGMTTIGRADIFNRTRTMTTTELMDQVANALYICLGNFVFSGWQLSSSMLNVTVSPGTGFLAGVANTNEEDYTITTLRAREYLYNERDRHPDTGLFTGNLRYVGENLTLDKDPDYPSTLRFYIKPSVNNVEGDIYISGYDIAGNYRNNEILHVACPLANHVYEFVTSTTFRSIDHEGIDAHDLKNQDAACRLWVKDSPIAYIYAVGTNSGRPLFEAVYERLSPVPVNKLFLGYAITDEQQVIEMQRWITDSFAEVVEDLTTNGRADGYNKVFVMNDMPKEGTETVVLDGIVLMKDSPRQKGYTIQGNVITLQENVPAPDSAGNVSGNGPADFWVKYRRV